MSPLGNDSASDSASDSLRDLVIGAGLEVLDRDGLGLGTGSITYARVFEHLEASHSVRVTRASVHKRIWARHDDFRRDVAVEAVKHSPTEVSATEDAVLLSTADRLARTVPSDYARLSTFAKLVGHDLFTATLNTPSANITQSLKALACRTDDKHVTEEMRRLLNERSGNLLSHRSNLFLTVMGSLQIRPKPSLGLGRREAADLFYTMAISLFVGGSLNHLAGCHAIGATRTSRGPATDGRPWITASIGLDALLQFLFEADSSAAAEHLARREASAPARSEPVVPAAPSESARRTREELRQLVLAAGVEVLLRDGLRLQPESLRYATVFSHLEDTRGIRLHRSDVHDRLWANNEEYWLEVLTAAIEAEPPPTPAAATTQEALTSEEPAAAPRMRIKDVQDILRTFVPIQIDTFLGSPADIRYHLIKAAVAHQPPSPAIEAVKQKVERSHQSRADRYAAAIKDFVIRRGFRVRGEHGLAEDEALTVMTVLSLSSTAGAIFDQMAGIQATRRSFELRSSDQPDEFEDWTPPALAARAYFEYLFEETGPDR